MAQRAKPDNTEGRPAYIRKVFDRYNNRWREIREQAELDEQCLSELGPWPEKERTARNIAGQERPCLHEDIISQYLNMVINQMEMNPMGIDAQPEEAGADDESAEELESRIRQIEYEQNGPHSYLNAGKCAVRSGFGAWELDTDWKSPASWEKYICIKPILDPFTVVPDPDAQEPDWCDMNGLFKCFRMTHDEFKQKYPKRQIQDFAGLIGKQDYAGWVDENSVMIAVFWERKRKKRKLLLLDDGTPEGWTLFEDEMPDVLKRFKNTMRLVTNGFAGLGYDKGREFPILRESDRWVFQVTKELTNGLEILDKTDWEDEEIPVLIVTGRQSFEPVKGGGPGKRRIDSLTRKGRTAQMLHDHCISSIQEECGLVPKSTFMGYEGQFDTSTNWATINRLPTGFAEARATTDEAGSEKPLPLPTIIQRRAQIDQLLMWKEAISISLQNSLGMQSTERKDRTAKSAKALDALEQTMNVATYHYHNALKVAQTRQYRIINRLLPKVENTSRTVGLRDVKGDFKSRQIPDNYWQKKHQIVISSGKYYQSMQEEQSDFADNLISSVKDPMIMLAVLPSLIRMRGLGPFGDDLAKMIEAIQPPQMQQAREGEDGQDQTMMLQQALVQAKQALAAVNKHAEMTEQRVIELEDEKKAKVVDNQSKEQIAARENETRIQIQKMKDEAEFEIKKLELDIEKIRAISQKSIANDKNETDVYRDERKAMHADVAQDKEISAAQNEREETESANA